MKSRPRGILLITALMICIILLLVGMGLLGSQASRYEAAIQSTYISQARQLALAGLEDARAKLELDIDFPPRQGPGQFIFSYSETLVDDPTPSKTKLGTYSVAVDMTYATDLINPATTTGKYIIVTSVGTVGPTIHPISQYRFRAEIDNLIPPASRPNVTGLNTNRFFRYTHIEDEEMP